MNGIADVLTSQMVKDQCMTQTRYDELIVARTRLNDLYDLISIKVKNGKGISKSELRLIYDLQINLESEETTCN